jgi:hypothetical protein
MATGTYPLINEWCGHGLIVFPHIPDMIPKLYELFPIQ